MHKIYLFILLFFSFAFTVPNAAAAPPASAPANSLSAPLNSVNQSLDLAVKDTTVKLQNIAVKWLSAFILLQFFITNFSALKSGAEIDSVVFKFIGSIAWFSICFLIMDKGAQFLSDVSGGFFATASEIAGGGGNFDVADILSKGCESASILITNVTDAASYVSLIPAVIIAGLLGIIILGVSALIAFKLFIIKIEVMLLIMMAPLSFAFLGLNTMKDQGIAPFKSLISLMYRIILLAVIMSAMGSVGNNLNTVINSVDKTSFVSGMWQSLFGAVVAFALLGYLAYKSDAMAANLSSGSTSLGTSDVAGSAAMGAAMGAAIATGGVAAIAAGAKGGQSMGDFMKSMTGGTGGASDASSGRGAGGGALTAALSPAPNMSTAKPSGSTNSKGVPVSDTAKFADAGPSPAEMAAGGGGNAGPSPAQIAAGEGGGAPNMEQQIKGDAGRIESAWNTPGGDPIEAADKRNRPGGGATPGSSDSGATAGIGGSGGGNKLEDTLTKIANHLETQGAPKKPGFKDHMSSVNQQALHERSSVGVSINPNVE